MGLLGLATDRYAILARSFPDVDVLGVPVLKTRLYGTNLIGMFCCGNSNGLLLPYFVSEDEMEKITGFLGEFDVAVGKLEDEHTAIGNLVACNDRGAIVSPKIGDVKIIEETLGVECVKMGVGGHEESGACIAATNKGFLAHPDAEEETGKIKKVLRVNGAAGSVNYGFPFVKSGLIANSHGYVTGQLTTGIELGRIDEALDFI